MTDTAATRPYGVLGRVLGHSYTPTIYKELAGLEYVRFEREPEDLEAFMTGNEWEGTNVTIPYKRAVMKYLDELSPLAERMGNVNTITRLPDGRLRGDNTDYFWFSVLVEELGVGLPARRSSCSVLPVVPAPRQAWCSSDTAPSSSSRSHEARSTTAISRSSPTPPPARQLHACRHVPPLPRRALHTRRARCARRRYRHCLQPRPHGSDARGRASRNPLHRWSCSYARGPGCTSRRALHRTRSPRASASWT